MAEFDGELPRSVDGLLTLKGVGRYTAGAVACFAYEQPVAMVDTNVRRVLSRVFGVEPATVERLADAVVPADAAYAWNQALMDLGATLVPSAAAAVPGVSAGRRVRRSAWWPAAPGIKTAG